MLRYGTVGLNVAVMRQLFYKEKKHGEIKREAGYALR